MGSAVSDSTRREGRGRSLHSAAFGWLVGPAHERSTGEKGAGDVVLDHLLEWATGEGEQSRLGPSGRKRERERFPFSYFKTNFKYKPNRI